MCLEKMANNDLELKMSVLKPIIAQLSNNHNLTPGIDSNKKRMRRTDRDQCPLSSGIEYSFVNLFCDEIIRRLSLQNQHSYQHIFFVPNLKAEAKVGYDLSIGHYRQNRRVRTMHKVINERYCDQPWSYRFKFDQTQSGEATGDYGHFLNLLNPRSADFELRVVNIRSFIVINICYCIHDYRRMGIISEHHQIEVPAFSSLLRTIIVDLQALREQISLQNIDVSSDQFYLKISRRPEEKTRDESPSDYLARIANKNNIHLECATRLIVSENVILSFDEFFQRNEWDRIMLGERMENQQ